MKILIVAATNKEMSSIKKGIKSANIKTNLDIDYLCSGIGNYETIFSLENYLVLHPEPTFIWNIGICGYWNSKNEKKTEAIQVSNIINIHNEKEYILPPFIQIAPLRVCFCSDNVITEKPNFKKEIGVINDEMYFDMESWGVEFVASKHKLPRLILKIPCDFIGDDTKKLFNKDGKFTGENISESLENLMYHDYLINILGWINQQG